MVCWPVMGAGGVGCSYGDWRKKSEERRMGFLPRIKGLCRTAGETEGLDAGVGLKEGEGNVARDHQSLVLFVFSPNGLDAAWRQPFLDANPGQISPLHGRAFDSSVPGAPSNRRRRSSAQNTAAGLPPRLPSRTRRCRCRCGYIVVVDALHVRRGARRYPTPVPVCSPGRTPTPPAPATTYSQFSILRCSILG